MSWHLLAEVRDRNFATVAACCRARRGDDGEEAPIPFNAVHGKLLMLLLAEWCNDEGAAVYPRSKAAFASACGLSERQVQRLFAGLIEAGLVKIARKEDAQAKTPRLYRINIGALLDLPLTEVARGDRERQRRARDRDRTGDQQSPQRETSSRGTGDQESGTGDQQSPIVTPSTPTEPLEAPPLGSPPRDGALFGVPDQEIDHGRKQTGRGSRLEADWQPPAEAWDFGRRLGLDEREVADELDRFRDYWIAKPGKDGRKLDWWATFRNWLRRTADDRARGPGRAGGSSGGRDRPGIASVVAAVNRIRD